MALASGKSYPGPITGSGTKTPGTSGGAMAVKNEGRENKMEVETIVVIDGGGQYLHAIRSGFRTADFEVRDGVIYAVMRRVR